MVRHRAGLRLGGSGKCPESLKWVVNGKGYILPERAQALANYPHMREAAGLLFVSGISARRPDGTVEGADLLPDGHKRLDIRAQTRAVLENLRGVLRPAGANLGNLVDVTAFLVDMADFAGYNEVYDEYFHAAQGPARTTVGVKQLPGPDLLIEIKAVALKPRAPHARPPDNEAEDFQTPEGQTRESQPPDTQTPDAQTPSRFRTTP